MSRRWAGRFPALVWAAPLAGPARETAVREARAAERTAIAWELHDLVAHHLASVAMGVGAARLALGGREPEAAGALDGVHATTRTALHDLRRLVAALRDAGGLAEEPGAALAGPDGLAVALSAAVERARGAGPAVDAEIGAEVSTVDSIRRLAVLRVVQEGLTNVVKHAGPGARVSLRVHARAGELTVEIRDDGGDGRERGEHERAEYGFGLVGVRERVELLGGRMRAGPCRRGWELAVAVPAGTWEDER